MVGCPRIVCIAPHCHPVLHGREKSRPTGSKRHMGRNNEVLTTLLEHTELAEEWWSRLPIYRSISFESAVQDLSALLRITALRHQKHETPASQLSKTVVMYTGLCPPERTREAQIPAKTSYRCLQESRPKLIGGRPHRWARSCSRDFLLCVSSPLVDCDGWMNRRTWARSHVLKGNLIRFDAWLGPG